MALRSKCTERTVVAIKSAGDTIMSESEYIENTIECSLISENVLNSKNHSCFEIRKKVGSPGNGSGTLLHNFVKCIQFGRKRKLVIGV